MFKIFFNPGKFENFAKFIHLPLLVVSTMTLLIGLVLVFFFSPNDYQQGSTVKIMYGGKNWLIDPFLGDMNSLPSFAGKSANPIVPLPIIPSEILKDIDYILITHLHPDHFDQYLIG